MTPSWNTANVPMPAVVGYMWHSGVPSPCRAFPEWSTAVAECCASALASPATRLVAGVLSVR
jgi:hypothetical protein